jgi:predicted amidohydrolase
MALVFGFAERAGERIYNSAGVIDSDGSWLGVRRKNPLYPYAYETGSFVEPPRDERSTVFDTKLGRIGVSICFDGSFPESIRAMRSEGAEILVWINAALCDPVLGTLSRICEAGAHARANNLWVVCCNCAASNSSGMSGLHAPNGEPLVLLSPDREELGIATIDLSMAADWAIWRDRIAKEVRAQEHGG